MWMLDVAGSKPYQDIGHCLAMGGRLSNISVSHWMKYTSHVFLVFEMGWLSPNCHVSWDYKANHSSKISGSGSYRQEPAMPITGGERPGGWLIVGCAWAHLITHLRVFGIEHQHGGSYGQLWIFLVDMRAWNLVQLRTSVTVSYVSWPCGESLESRKKMGSQLKLASECCKHMLVGDILLYFIVCITLSPTIMEHDINHWTGSIEPTKWYSVTAIVSCKLPFLFGSIHPYNGTYFGQAQ